MSLRRDGRAVECTGLENRQGLTPFQGSNPCPSTIYSNHFTMFSRLKKVLINLRHRAFSYRVSKPVVISEDFLIDKHTYDKFLSLDLKPIRLESVDILSMKTQTAFYLKDYIDSFYSDEAGNVDKCIKNSPHFKFLNDYKKFGIESLKKDFLKTEYYNFFKGMNRIGKKINIYSPDQDIVINFSDSELWEKALKFIELYESIKKHGYLGKKRFQCRYIIVLEEPFIESRFGIALNQTPYEIFSGHHRAACLLHLGHDFVKTLIIKDKSKKKYKCN